MNPYQLILLRMYNMTFGRIPAFSFLLKKIMIYFLIKRSSSKYVAASRFFDYRRFIKGKG